MKSVGWAMNKGKSAIKIILEGLSVDKIYFACKKTDYFLVPFVKRDAEMVDNILSELKLDVLLAKIGVCLNE